MMYCGSSRRLLSRWSQKQLDSTRQKSETLEAKIIKSKEKQSKNIKIGYKIDLPAVLFLQLYQAEPWRKILTMQQLELLLILTGSQTGLTSL